MGQLDGDYTVGGVELVLFPSWVPEQGSREINALFVAINVHAGNVLCAEVALVSDITRVHDVVLGRTIMARALIVSYFVRDKLGLLDRSRGVGHVIDSISAEWSLGCRCDVRTANHTTIRVIALQSGT